MRPPASRRDSRHLVELFDRLAVDYDRVGPAFFAAFAELLVERAAPPAGGLVLDIGTGHGAALAALGRRDPNSRGLGVDLSLGMLARAARDPALPAARWLLSRMDGACLGVEAGVFDVVLCGFTLDLCPRPKEILAQARQAMRPNGRLAVTTWAADCPYFRWLTAAFDAVLPSRRVVSASSPVVSSAAGLRGLLEECALTDVQVETVDRTFHYADLDEWWSSLWTHCPRAVLEAMGRGAVARSEAALRDRATELVDARGPRAELRAHLALARRPRLAAR